jgi:hypothetical protein
MVIKHCISKLQFGFPHPAGNCNGFHVSTFIPASFIQSFSANYNPSATVNGSVAHQGPVIPNIEPHGKSSAGVRISRDPCFCGNFSFSSLFSAELFVFRKCNHRCPRGLQRTSDPSIPPTSPLEFQSAGGLYLKFFFYSAV